MGGDRGGMLSSDAGGKQGCRWWGEMACTHSKRGCYVIDRELTIL